MLRNRRIAAVSGGKVLNISCFCFAPANCWKFFRPWQDIIYKTVFPVILVVLQYSQDMFKIPERIQIVSFCRFCDAVDNGTGICAIQTVNQLPCMLMETKGRQSTFIALPAFLPNIPPSTALFHTSLWRPQRQHTDNAILPRQRP